MRPITALNGKVETYIPGSITDWYALPQGARTATGGADRVVAYVGKALGGVPGRGYLFTDVATAQKVLLAGDLLTATVRALSQTDRPRAVLAVNVTGGTPATFAVKDAANATVATLTTLTYREYANQTQISITGNATTGLRVALTDPGTGAQVVSNLVGLALTLQYQGAGTNATAEIVDQGGTRYLRTTVTGAANDSLMVPLTGHTVQSLARKVQELGPYAALVARDGRLSATAMDLTAPVSINTHAAIGGVGVTAAAGATTLTITAATRAVTSGELLRLRTPIGWSTIRVTAAAASGATSLTVEALAADVPAGSGVFDAVQLTAPTLSALKGDLMQFFATRAAGIVTAVSGPSNLIAKAQTGFFAGGQTVADTAADWQAAVSEAFETSNFSTFAALTDERALAYGLRAEVLSRRGPDGGKWVQVYSGVSTDLLPTDSTAASLTAYLGDFSSEAASASDRDVTLIGQTLDMLDPATGTVITEKPYMVAAAVAALRAGLGIGPTLTYKFLGGSNPQPNICASEHRKVYANGFTRAGMMVLEAPTRGGAARIVLGRTAYVGEDNTVYESEKQVAIMNAITRDVRDLQDAMVPGDATADRIGQYKTALEDYFEDARDRRRWIQSGLDESGRSVPAFRYNVGPTQQYSRLIVTTSTVCPVGEFVVGVHTIAAQAVEIEA